MIKSFYILLELLQYLYTGYDIPIAGVEFTAMSNDAKKKYTFQFLFY